MSGEHSPNDVETKSNPSIERPEVEDGVSEDKEQYQPPPESNEATKNTSIVNHNMIDTNKNIVEKNISDDTTKQDDTNVLSESYIEENLKDKITVGCVKWFNIKVGYGFITINHNDNTYDLFVHHSAIKTCIEIYRYLVQGEYVQFEWGKTSNKKYNFQAINVSGINAGKLMCETRNESRQTNTSYDRNRYDRYSKHRVNVGNGNVRSDHNENSNATSDQWTVVKRNRSSGGARERTRGKSHAQTSPQIPTE